MPRDLFTAPIDAIQITDVLHFLADAEEDEGINWEAKADHAKGSLDSGPIRKAVCAFANGREPGIVLIGADYEAATKSWRLPGLRRPPRIPVRRWLDQVIRDGVTPIPEFELRTFRGTGSHGPIAVVRVQPLTIKPAVTSGGGIYTRTMSGSVPMKDPALIADLFRQGESAQKQAEELAHRLITERLPSEALDAFDTHAVGYKMAVCPVGLPDDLPVRIFRKSFAADGLPGVLDAAYRGSIAVNSPVSVAKPRGDRTIAWVDPFLGWEERVVVEVLRDGALLLSGVVPSALKRPEAITRLARGFDPHRVIIQRLADVLGLRGPAFVCFVMYADTGFATSEGWTDVEVAPTVDELALAVRDLRRGFGVADWEPEADQ